MPQDTRAARRPHMAMLVGNRVVGDSRVEKAAVSAVRAGYRVTIVGISHRLSFSLGRYGTVPILRVPVAYHRHRAWSALHAPELMERTHWSASVPEDRLAAMADLEAPAEAPGLAAAAARGASPHVMPDDLRGRLGRLARRLDARLPAAPAPLSGAARGPSARARRAVENFRSGHAQGWRRTWPLIADFEDAFLRALVELEPDVIHVHDRHPMPAADAYRRLLLAQGRPSVPWVYDAHEWIPGQAIPGPVQQRIGWKAAEAELIRRADAVLTVSDELAERLRRYHDLPDLPGTVPNAPWSVRSPLEPTRRRTVREECGLAEDVPLLVYLGRIAEVRGVHTVVRALARVPQVHAAFVVSAELGARQALLEQAERLGVADRVHILDYVPSASVTWYVESATLGLSPLLPTPAHESAVATKLREYLLAGLPLVVSDLREQARFVREQGVGTVHAPDDAEDLARAVRVALADLPRLRGVVADPALQDAHRWEGGEKVLHRVWASLMPVSETPLPAVIAPDSEPAPTPTALAVIGDTPAGVALTAAWAATGRPASARPARPAPEERTALAGGPAELAAVLDEWIHDDLTAEAVLYTGQGPAAGRAGVSEGAEVASLLDRGRAVGVLAGDVPLVDARLRRLAVPGHPWNELEPEHFERLARQTRRARRPFSTPRPAGVPLLSHRWVDAVLDPDVTWLPRPVLSAPSAVAGPRSVLVVPGSRTADERRAVDALTARLESAGVPVEAPSRRRFERLGAGAWTASIVVDPLFEGEPTPVAEAAWARGAAVVGGPLLFTDRPGLEGPRPPLVLTDPAGLADIVHALLDEDEAACERRRTDARRYHEQVHAPAAVVARLRRHLGLPQTDR